MKRKENMEANVMNQGIDNMVTETKPRFWRSKKGKATAVGIGVGTAGIITMAVKKFGSNSGFAEHDGISEDWDNPVDDGIDADSSSAEE